MKIFSNLPRKIFIHVIVTVVSSQNIQHSMNEKVDIAGRVSNQGIVLAPN